MGVHSIKGGFLEGLRHHPKFLPSSRCALLKEIVAIFVNFELPKSDEKEKDEKEKSVFPKSMVPKISK